MGSVPSLCRCDLDRSLGDLPRRRAPGKVRPLAQTIAPARVASPAFFAKIAPVYNCAQGQVANDPRTDRLRKRSCKIADYTPPPLPKGLSITFASLLKTCRKFTDREASQIAIFNLYKGSFFGSRRTSPRAPPHPGVSPAAIQNAHARGFFNNLASQTCRKCSLGDAAHDHKDTSGRGRLCAPPVASLPTAHTFHAQPFCRKRACRQAKGTVLRVRPSAQHWCLRGPSVCDFLGHDCARRPLFCYHGGTRWVQPSHDCALRKQVASIETSNTLIRSSNAFG